MSFTTQSESVPLVEATRLASGRPLIFTGAVRTSDSYTSTSGREAASRWSRTSQLFQGSVVEAPAALPSSTMGLARKGTGFAGSETYSSKAASLLAGAANPALNPGRR